MRLFLTVSLLSLLGVGDAIRPGGVHSSEATYLVPAGRRITHLKDEIRVLSPNGTTLHASGSNSDHNRIAPREESGYIAFAFWASPDQTSNVIASFKMTWTVPPEPATSNGQTVFYFNAVNQQAGVSTIIQPVLQWGVSDAGGGNYWSVASWYLFNGTEFFTPLVRVNPGDVLDANIELTSTNGTAYNYTVEFSNIPGTRLHVENAVEAYTAATATLEAYSITSASDYPVGKTVFDGLHIRMQDGRVPSVMWAITSDEADGVSMVVDEDGAERGRLTIVY